MKKTQKYFLALSVLTLVISFNNLAFGELNLDKLSAADIQKVKDLIHKLDPLIVERDKKRDLAKLTFAELYAPLDQGQKEFLKQFENLDAEELNVKIPFRGFATGKEGLVLIIGQKVKVRDKKKEGTDKDVRDLSPQFLPPKVFQQYLTMMKAMQEDIDKRLLIESGYRSSAYQLYLFVFYLSNHDYSIRETVKFVALPGYSEHGSPKNQAIDFINPDGINGEDNPKEFEALPEYEWLLKNAGRFGFVLSYPKSDQAGITFEPWHWRFDETRITQKTRKESKKDQRKDEKQK
jgi:LAS superfamily LD-carboxypeptidase LdcB